MYTFLCLDKNRSEMLSVSKGFSRLQHTQLALTAVVSEIIVSLQYLHVIEISPHESLPNRFLSEPFNPYLAPLKPFCFMCSLSTCHSLPPLSPPYHLPALTPHISMTTFHVHPPPPTIFPLSPHPPPRHPQPTRPWPSPVSCPHSPSRTARQQPC